MLVKLRKAWIVFSERPIALEYSGSICHEKMMDRNIKNFEDWNKRKVYETRKKFVGIVKVFLWGKANGMVSFTFLEKTYFKQ